MMVIHGDDFLVTVINSNKNNKFIHVLVSLLRAQ